MGFPTRQGPTLISTTTATWYTAPQSLRLTDVVLTNWGFADATVNLYLVPSGSSFANANKILGDQAVPANDVVRLERFNIVVNVGDAFVIRSSTTAVNIIGTLSDEKPPH